jgi:DNA-binding Lrp family transcriptional regulator
MFLGSLALKFELDAYDRKILALLQQDARLSYSEIGRRIHLTSPAVAERVRKLEEAGVIEGFGVRLNRGSWATASRRLSASRSIRTMRSMRGPPRIRKCWRCTRPRATIARCCGSLCRRRSIWRDC